MAAPRIVLVRHAQAGDPGDWSGADRDRPLDAKGQHSALRMARALASLLPAGNALCSSPYLRARQTAAPLAQALDTPLRQQKWLAPGEPSGIELEKLARSLPDTGCLVMVGHEPDLSLLAGRLLGSTSAVVRMGKGAACGFAGTLPGPMELVWHLPRRILERLAANDGG
jgi:phosphohistidine phosphatase